jgi:Polyketide cyclase / dehydrase and lipid transport
MAAGAVDVTLSAAPDEVWKVVGDFGGLREFFPGIESFELQGDDRVIGMFGMSVRERLLAKDDAERVLTYSVIEGVPVDSHTATISVEVAVTARRSSGPTTSPPTRWPPSSATPTRRHWRRSRGCSPRPR